MSEFLRNIAAGMMVVCAFLLALAGALVILAILLSVNDWLWVSHHALRLPVLRVVGVVVVIAALWWIGKTDRAETSANEVSRDRE